MLLLHCLFLHSQSFFILTVPSRKYVKSLECHFCVLRLELPIHQLATAQSWKLELAVLSAIYAICYLLDQVPDCQDSDNKEVQWPACILWALDDMAWLNLIRLVGLSIAGRGIERNRLP